ncbi:hypothetical protein CAOG_02080 [Capsaspora owczarzaki ATCC 30864]|uniref:hypothetical protein n=1 Tax=Capsaspora owczarzaki (strain ATCC 30864) TaxID=595528 RepID=UPI0001FE6921|nr:hypothetical protein CAOG_02080 [Capsaspora owczarzaki ATCC 30864]|eukprot:XP_004348830.1 hypothetical protein CAOG_02080 [Capsaspora owczarzaki ATCC 30864]
MALRRSNHLSGGLLLHVSHSTTCIGEGMRSSTTTRDLQALLQRCESTPESAMVCSNEPGQQASSSSSNSSGGDALRGSASACTSGVTASVHPFSRLRGATGRTESGSAGALGRDGSIHSSNTSLCSHSDDATASAHATLPPNPSLGSSNSHYEHVSAVMSNEQLVADEAAVGYSFPTQHGAKNTKNHSPKNLPTTMTLPPQREEHDDQVSALSATAGGAAGGGGGGACRPRLCLLQVGSFPSSSSTNASEVDDTDVASNKPSADPTLDTEPTDEHGYKPTAAAAAAAAAFNATTAATTMTDVKQAGHGSTASFVLAKPIAAFTLTTTTTTTTVATTPLILGDHAIELPTSYAAPVTSSVVASVAAAAPTTEMMAATAEAVFAHAPMPTSAPSLTAVHHHGAAARVTLAAAIKARVVRSVRCLCDADFAARQCQPAPQKEE